MGSGFGPMLHTGLLVGVCSTVYETDEPLSRRMCRFAPPLGRLSALSLVLGRGRSGRWEFPVPAGLSGAAKAENLGWTEGPSARGSGIRG